MMENEKQLKKHNFSKLKAGALQFTMFIVVVIALLLSTFIILTYTHKTFKLQTSFVLETIDNSDKGINHTLLNHLQLNDTVTVNLQDEDYKSLKVHKSFWGLFEKVTSVSKIKNKTFKKTALIGASQPDVNRTALYIKDNNRPLVLVGNTKIQGVAYLPKQGVRTGNISGHSYYGNRLIYGPEKISRDLPKLNADMLTQIKNIVKIYKFAEPNQFLDLSRKRTYQNSFYNPLQIIYSLQPINLSGVNLTGHILVQSESKIIVDASSKLKDVVLIAPIIDIKSNTQSTFQAFATKQITVGNRCKLNYPSALILSEKKQVISSTDNLKETPTIKLGKNSTIKGAIVYLGTSKNYKPQIFIEEGTTVTGEVYCNQNLELLGHVNGCIYTSNFVANQSGSVYQNHIYNGSIEIDKLPFEYIGLTFNKSKKGVMKWLY